MTSKPTYCYDYPRPALTVDAVVFGKDGAATKLLLIKRKAPPFAGQWALPGGFMDENETAEAAVKRELKEETDVSLKRFIQIKTFSDPKRDPRHRTVTIAFLAITDCSKHKIKGSDDASDAQWFDLKKLPRLAFDHNAIIKEARKKLKEIERLEA